MEMPLYVILQYTWNDLELGLLLSNIEASAATKHCPSKVGFGKLTHLCLGSA